jgi:2-polyprenyl-3-methyl-5-hydroxy-6-metoxy-1,4-benzoquinol methylase
MNPPEPAYLSQTGYQKFPGGRRKLALVAEVHAAQAAGLGRRVDALDVGCGNGPISLPLASLGARVTGIDVSPESVALVSGKNPFPDARFLVHDLSLAPLPERYDLVVCSEVLEHLPDPAPLVRGLAGAMADGALLIVTVPNGYGPREVLGRLEHRIRRSRVAAPLAGAVRSLLRMKSAKEKWEMHTSCQEQDHVQKFTPGSLTRLLSDGGLEVTRWVNSFWLLSLFGKAQQGTGFAARLDEGLADLLPRWCASGWFVVCRKR